VLFAIVFIAPNPTDAIHLPLQSVLGIILGGGAGTRLYPLTKKRAKPAVPLGANYRLIDIPVSNCLNSNVSKIYVLTQFNSASLNRHLSRAYGNNISGYKNEGFVEVLAAQQSPENPNWFQVRLGFDLSISNYSVLTQDQKFCTKVTDFEFK
jgi:ADP-glucose pyrophosphorylase